MAEPEARAITAEDDLNDDYDDGWDDDRTCEWCQSILDCNDPTDCDRCNMPGCHACVRIWDDVFGYLCGLCEREVSGGAGPIYDPDEEAIDA